MKARKPRTSRALLDVILSVLAIVLLLIAPPTEGEVIKRVDYVLEVSWPDSINVDVDTWIMLPDGKKCSYRNKDIGYVSLDRDDLGTVNDPGIANIEVASFRKPMDGVYYVSIYNYRTSGVFNPEWKVHLVFRDLQRKRVAASIIVPMPEPFKETSVWMIRMLDGRPVEIRESARRIVG